MAAVLGGEEYAEVVQHQAFQILQLTKEKVQALGQVQQLVGITEKQKKDLDLVRRELATKTAEATAATVKVRESVPDWKYEPPAPPPADGEGSAPD